MTYQRPGNLPLRDPSTFDHPPTGGFYALDQQDRAHRKELSQFADVDIGDGTWIANRGETMVTQHGQRLTVLGWSDPCIWNDERERYDACAPDNPDAIFTGLDIKWKHSGVIDTLRKSSRKILSGVDADGRAELVLPTTYVWRDPALIDPRPWVYGRQLLRKQVSGTVAPPGLGKSSLTIVEALAMVTGRDLLGDTVHGGPKSVWLFNLEDPRDELERRIAAAMQHHGINPAEIGDRLHIDSGRDRPLCTAIQTREGTQIIEPVFDDLARQIRGRRIDVLVVDPFVSSHQVSENDNGAIDLVAKKWAKLADECNCAIELVHHTRKTNGEEATTEAARGASSLMGAARSGRVLNRMTSEERESAGIPADDLSTYFAVTRDKANLAPAGARQWRHMASVHLANGDDVGVAELWAWPDTFDGFTSKDLLRVQTAIDGKQPRYSDQAGDDWVGVIVAEVLALDATTDRKRIKHMIEDWLKSGALVKAMHEDKKRMMRPCVEVGEWATE